MAGTLNSPYGGGKYERQRRSVENQYTNQSATQAYGRFLGNQRGTRNLSDTTRNFKRGYAPRQANWQARGLSGPGINSGARQRAMSDYVGDYYRDYGRQQQDLGQMNQQYDLDQSMRDAWRQEQLTSIEQQRTLEMAQAAQQLQALRDYLGGI